MTATVDVALDVADVPVASRPVGKRAAALLRLEPRRPDKVVDKAVDNGEIKLPPTKAESPPKPAKKLVVPSVVKAVKAKRKAPSLLVPIPIIKKQPPRSCFLELGNDFKIAHKPGSAYSILYQVVATRGNFCRAVEMMDAKCDPKDAAQADTLLGLMLVPINQLEEWCRNEAGWQDYAGKRTEKLKKLADEGDKQAQSVLDNEDRSAKGEWQGNIAEMISTCVGSYAAFLKGWNGNKNVEKFSEAKLLFRRFPFKKRSQATPDCFVMMYPEKYEGVVKQALETKFGKDE